MSCRNITSPEFSGSNLDRALAIVNPATENTLSDGADVAGIAKTFLAIEQQVMGIADFSVATSPMDC